MTTKKKNWAAAERFATRIENETKARKETKHVLDRATTATEVFKLLPKKPYTADTGTITGTGKVTAEGETFFNDHYALGDRYLTTAGTGNLTLAADTTVTLSPTTSNTADLGTGNYLTGTYTWEYVLTDDGRLSINWGTKPVEKDKHLVIRDL